jgi:benzodiazapine receptor
MKVKIGRLVLSILACQAAGALGSAFTMPAITTWYASLAKPWFTPPNWLFGPVWLALYTLMGVSLYIVREKGGRKNAQAVYIFCGQLGLNMLWSVLFFGLRSPLLGMACIAALWAAIAATIYKFYPIDRRAAMLMVPYIAWVTIAAALNYYVLVLNA